MRKKLVNIRIYICIDKTSIAVLFFKDTEQIKEVKDFDVVFNTVPSLIFTKEVLKNTHKNTLFIDLASLPGGIDKASAKEYNIDVISSGLNK